MTLDRGMSSTSSPLPASGQVTLTARRLHARQASRSVIRALERQLDVAPLGRHAGGVKLTTTGTLCLKHRNPNARLLFALAAVKA